MGAALIRFGITVMLLDVCMLVVCEYFLDLKIYPVVQKIGMGAIGLILLGFVFRMLGKGTRAVTARRGRCVRCRERAVDGSLYCKVHLDAAAEEYRAESITRNRR